MPTQIMAQHMSQDEVKGLQELFESWDTDHSGTISLDELRQGLQRRGVAVPEQLLAQIMDMADLNHNRCGAYREPCVKERAAAA
jgi:calcium-dependent protein kinase